MNKLAEFASNGLLLGVLCATPRFVLEQQITSWKFLLLAAGVGFGMIICLREEHSIQLNLIRFVGVVAILVLAAPEWSEPSVARYDDAVLLASFCRGAASIFLIRSVLKLLRGELSLSTNATD